jgi:hypothetical protein
MRSESAVLFAALLSLAVGLPAQAPTPVPGARVRVQTEARRQQIGMLTMMDVDSIIVRDLRGAPAHTFYAIDVRRLDVSAGRSSLTGAARGAGFGLLIGVAAGAVAGSTSTGGTEPDDFMTAMGVLIGAGAGTVIGTIVGSVMGAERWKTVAWPR